MKLRTSDSRTDEEAGYQVSWPPAMAQPPAVIVCPREFVTSSSHFVPAGIPLTRTLSSSPHAVAAYLMVALACVRGLVAPAGLAHRGAVAEGGRGDRPEACQPTAAPAPAITPAAAAAATRVRSWRRRALAVRSTSDRSAGADR